MKDIKIAMVEDDPHIRALVSQYLNQQDHLQCLILASSVEEFFETVSPKAQIDVLIQDISLPGISGLEAIHKIKNKFPNTEILMFTIHDDASRVFKALSAGASGYLLKNTKLEQIKKAIIDINNGKAAMSPSVAKKVINYFRPKPNKDVLTDKETQVVQLLADGLSYKMIADRLQIKFQTVQSHIKNIYKKLHVHSKAEVISKHLRGEL
ncbi:response regulator [Portibacter marinus]|uniref:response regulator n=1 Tax=Portibacter marinus TaxID=2898660 RepID=UPI001F475469|nr:response regulator transcription factor [Portibacter marinus]